MKTLFAIIASTIVVCTGTINGAELWKPSELSLSLFGGWIDKSDNDIAPGAGVSYFLSRQLGVGAFTQWENFDGRFFDNVSLEAYFRLPLGGLPLAAYGVAALGHSFETEEEFESFGGGAELRITEKWGVFADGRWQFNNDTDDGAAIRVGARLAF